MKESSIDKYDPIRYKEYFLNKALKYEETFAKNDLI